MVAFEDATWGRGSASKLTHMMADRPHSLATCVLPQICFYDISTSNPKKNEKGNKKVSKTETIAFL